MSTKSRIKHVISFLLHGEPKPTVANITYLQPNNQLTGKKVIITGGNRGLGFAMAKKFKAEGADVLISGRSEKTLKASAKEIGCKYLMLDIQNVDSFLSFINEADCMLGGANCLVNNAGISLHENGFLNVNPDQFTSQFDTNLKGPFFLTQCFLNKCKDHDVNGYKKVLFTSSETSMTVDERPTVLQKLH